MNLKIVKINKIYNDDCLNSSKYIEDESVDLFFCDPPYFISGNKNNKINLENGSRDDWDRQWNTKKEYYQWSKKYLDLAYKQLKKNGSIYVCISWEHSGKIQEILEKVGFTILNRITWKRDKGRGSNKNWKSLHEDIWFAVKDKNDYTFNINDIKIKKNVVAPYTDENKKPKDWFIEDGKKIRFTNPPNLWDEFTVPFWSMKEVKSYAKTKKTPDNKFQKHNTQKPKDLVKRCILASSNKNELVVDYFGGSGTAAIAAKELDRKYILFDVNKIYNLMAEQRLKTEVKKSLF